MRKLEKLNKRIILLEIDNKHLLTIMETTNKEETKEPLYRLIKNNEKINKLKNKILKINKEG